MSPRPPFAHPGERLQKILAAAGLGSRRHCETLITAGRVQIDGQTVTELGTRADPARQQVTVDGQPVRREPRQTYLADKPRGILCTSSDPQGRTTIIDWARQMGAPPRLRLYTVGRLDLHSEGLILLTNDGALAQALAHPRHQIEKEYRAWLHAAPTREQLSAMRRGVEEGGETLRALRVTLEAGQVPVLRVVLGEGRNRHIRRMLTVLGLRVKRLRRVRIGPLTAAALRGQPLRQLSPRECRFLEAGPDDARGQSGRRATSPRRPRQKS